MKKINIADGIVAMVGKAATYCEIYISDAIEKLELFFTNSFMDEFGRTPTEYDYIQRCTCISEFIQKYDIKNVKIIGGQNLKTTSNMFGRCINIESIDLSSFDTSNVTDMFAMFANCWKLQKINFNNFNTSNVKNMGDMFNECTNLKTLNLSNFKACSLQYADCMFINCTNLENIDFPNFELSDKCHTYGMTHRCISLKKINFPKSIMKRML